MVISFRPKLQSLNDYTMNIHIDGVPINQSNQSKSLGLLIDENLSWRPTFMKSLKKYPLVSVLLTGSGHLFQYTLQLKYTKVLWSHTLIIAALYRMVWPDSLVRNFKSFKIVLSELSWDSRSGTVAAEKVTLVSSAYILGAPTFKQFGISYISIKKRRGPIIDPWVTPPFKGFAPDRWLFTLYLWIRLVR